MNESRFVYRAISIGNKHDEHIPAAGEQAFEVVLLHGEKAIYLAIPRHLAGYCDVKIEGGGFDSSDAWASGFLFSTPNYSPENPSRRGGWIGGIAGPCTFKVHVRVRGTHPIYFGALVTKVVRVESFRAIRETEDAMDALEAGKVLMNSREGWVDWEDVKKGK